MSNRGHYLSCSSLPKVANLILTWSISYLFSVTPVLLCTLILLLLSPTLAFYSSTWRNRKWCFPHLMFSTFGTQYGNWRENFCYEALHAHLHFGGNRGGSLLCPCNICWHQRCQMTQQLMDQTRMFDAASLCLSWNIISLWLTLSQQPVHSRGWYLFYKESPSFMTFKHWNRTPVLACCTVITQPHKRHKICLRLNQRATPVWKTNRKNL